MFTTNVSSTEGGCMCVREHGYIEWGSSQIQPPLEAKLENASQSEWLSWKQIVMSPGAPYTHECSTTARLFSLVMCEDWPSFWGSAAPCLAWQKLLYQAGWTSEPVGSDLPLSTHLSAQVLCIKHVPYQAMTCSHCEQLGGCSVPGHPSLLLARAAWSAVKLHS